MMPLLMASAIHTANFNLAGLFCLKIQFCLSKKQSAALGTFVKALNPVAVNTST